MAQTLLETTGSHGTGDNIFAGHGLKKRLKAAVENAESGQGATVFGYYVDDPERFGIVELILKEMQFPSRKNRNIQRVTTVLPVCISMTIRL